MTPTTLRMAEPQSAHSASVCWSSCSSLSVATPRLKVVVRVDAASNRGEVLEAPRRNHARVLDSHAAEAHRPRQVAVVVAGAARWKDVDDHRRAGADLAFATVVRHGVVGRPGDDHVGARKPELCQ